MADSEAYESARLAGEWTDGVTFDFLLSAAEVRVALALRSYVNRDTGTAWPAVDTLAEEIGSKPATVRAALKRLVRLGWLVLAGPGGGRGKTTSYALGFDRLGEIQQHRRELRTLRDGRKTPPHQGEGKPGKTPPSMGEGIDGNTPLHGGGFTPRNTPPSGPNTLPPRGRKPSPIGDVNPPPSGPPNLYKNLSSEPAQQPIAAAAASKRGGVGKTHDYADDRWPLRLNAFRTHGTWLTDWGPKPGEPDCQIPPHLLREATR